MDVLNSRNQLIGEEEDGLERELSVAKVEEIFERGAKEIEHHGIVVTFGSEPANERNADASGERFVDSCFIFELRMLGLDGFEFDGDFFSRDDVSAQVDITKGTAANLAANSVFVTNTEILNCVSLDLFLTL